MNTECLISSWSITSKSTLMNPNNLVYLCVNLERRMLDIILYEVGNSDIPR
jgi:hypothetical protein